MPKDIEDGETLYRHFEQFLHENDVYLPPEQQGDLSVVCDDIMKHPLNQVSKEIWDAIQAIGGNGPFKVIYRDTGEEVIL